MWIQGKQNVEREFELLLNKTCEFLPTSFEISFENEYLEENNEYLELNYKEDDLKQLVNIIEWFKKAETNYLDKLYENIIRHRSQSILEAIKKYSFL